ncbi:MAG TPA: MFS transporter [Desulfobacterales bacterium]|nr:MFS transporter [Desulfobacterales bacterium]
MTPALRDRPSAPSTHSPLKPLEPFRAYVGPLALLSVVFFVNFVGRIALAPLLPAIEQDLHISHAQSGSLFFILSAAYCVALLGSGLVSSRLTHRRTIIVSMTGMGVALLLTAAGSELWSVRLGLVAAGLAAGLYLPSAMAAIMDLLPTRHWGKGIAAHEAAPNLAFVLAPFLCEALLSVLPWSAAIGAFGVASLAAAAAFAGWGRFGAFKGAAPDFRSVRSILAGRTYWMLMLVFGLGIGASLGIYAVLPIVLVGSHGLEREQANTILALTRIPGVAVAFVSGWFTDRFGPKRTMTTVLLLNGGLTFALAVLPMPWLLVPISIQPALSVCFFPAGFSAIGLSVPKASRNLAVALTTPAAFIIGAGLVPTLIGFAGDVWSFQAGLILTGGLVLAGSLLSSRLRVKPDA